MDPESRMIGVTEAKPIPPSTMITIAQQCDPDFIYEGDRCFVCYCNYKEVDSVNILLPCGHGWCCGSCLDKLDKCPLCNVVLTERQPIHIMDPNQGAVKGIWTENHALLDPTDSNCLRCWQPMQYVYNREQYINLHCGRGWFCKFCIQPLPKKCFVCDDDVDEIIQIFLS